MTGVNQFGTASDRTIIIYKRDDRTPPIVDFIQPSGQTTRVSQPRFAVEASVINVVAKEDVSVSVNGRAINDFSLRCPNEQGHFLT